tara:strand:+ start:349 stop:1233 length:885 start_codon:yes stop_codon:yes gene_type:complete
MSSYYDVLGLKKNCTDSEIRSAYKKLAFKWHPDKNSENKELANKKFKEISEAYKILGDKKKRNLYNKYGKENYGNEYTYNTTQNIYDNDIMKDLYNNINKTVNENLFKNEIKSPNVLYDLNCSIEELYNGCEKKIKIKRKIFDENKNIIRRELEIFKINIIPGWKNGTKITYKNKADIYHNMKQGDLIITIKEKNNKNLIREGNNIIFNKNISLLESLVGIDFFITLLNGKKKRIRLKQLYNLNSNHVIKNAGMPIRKNRKVVGNGDYIIKFNIKIPTLNNQDKKKLNDILNKY